jgi:uroporphyrinogen-III synthase
MTKSLPLAGLNIVVTRPQEQAGTLQKAIVQLGGSTILFPLLEIKPLTDDVLLRSVISRLHEFQLAIFISPNAVRFGMPAIQRADNLPPDLQIATIGLSSAKALTEFGIKKVISPQHRFDSEALLALPELVDVNDKHILIFRGDSGRELLGDTLKSRGAQVEYACCYHRTRPQKNINTLLDVKPDIITVSSSEALRNLGDLLDPINRVQLLTLPLFVSHHRIALAARHLGWQNIVLVDEGDEGLISALLHWSAHKKGKKHE